MPPLSTAGLRALAALLSGAAIVACGGDSEPTAEAPPVPPGCLDRWNEESPSQIFGRHAYNEHDARQAQVSELEPGKGAVNVRGASTCAVIFSVPESDQEYGEVGMVVTRFGWASMKELARGDPARLSELQDLARLAPNASVFPDGSIAES